MREIGEVVDKFIGVVMVAIPESARKEKLHDILHFRARQKPTLVLLHKGQRHTHDSLRSAFGKDDIEDAKQHG